MKRFDDRAGGFSTMHPVAMLPNGKSIRLAVLAHKNTPGEVQKSFQFRYASTGNDGQPVFYVVDISTDTKAPQVLSFALQLPAADAQSTERAVQLAGAINR